jgi:hypothetical protein
MVVRQNHRRGIARQSFLDHLARVHRGLRDGATEHLLQRDDAVLRIKDSTQNTSCSRAPISTRR